MDKKISVALVGAGSMGGALLRAWLAEGVIEANRSAVFEPSPTDWLIEAAAEHGFAVNPPSFDRAVDFLVVAVKPQAAADVLAPFAPLARTAIVLSVMAGKSIKAIERLTQGATRIVRAMPNLPAAVGAGVSGLYAPLAVTAADRAAAERLMRAVGEVVWVDSEAAIDAVTAVSGSGPAYFFLLGEALADAGRKAGLPEATARRLARATLVGAGAYVGADPRDLADLRRAVTSPGGTTEAALGVLDAEDDGLRALVEDAVSAACRRAAALTE